MERKLASIQKVIGITQIPNADSIEQITVLGWSLIAKKGEFKIGDLAVFFEVDSILPEADWSEFMRSKKFRVKTMKLNSLGVISAGLALPLSILPFRSVSMVLRPEDAPYQEGEDVTLLLGVTKHEVQDDVNLNGTKGVQGKPFPAGIPKTDEMRLQSIPWVLDLFAGKEFYITQKYDGCSATYFINPMTHEFTVASRNLSLDESDSIWWRVAREKDIERALREQPEGMVIQGEITGPGVQKNRMGWDSHQFNIFNIYNLKLGEYLGLIEMSQFCTSIGLMQVPVFEVGVEFKYTMEELVKIANDGEYLNGFPQEGIVVRPMQSRLHPLLGQVSFKVINENYLLKIG